MAGFTVSADLVDPCVSTSQVVVSKAPLCGGVTSAAELCIPTLYYPRRRGDPAGLTPDQLVTELWGVHRVDVVCQKGSVRA